MKISKLFHWLYAFVMFLPIFAIGVTCGYAMFNKNAYKSYSDTEVSSIKNVNLSSGVSAGITYTISYREDTGATPKIWYNSISVDWTEYGASSNYDYHGFYITGHSINLYETDTAPLVQMPNLWGITLNEFTFTASNNQNIMASAPIYLNILTFETQKLDNVFYYSVDKVTESPLFSWAYNSFLVAPFSYIAVLFSMPANSPIVMLLSYWLAISIIWLTFDVIMYVPLLVHRWLDKGVIE